MLRAAAIARATHPAVEEPPAWSISYAALDALADRTAAWLRAQGVRGGDRVGVVARKSIDAVAAQYGAMRAGAAYVPVDAHGPAWRAAYILADCRVSAAVVDAALLPALVREFEALHAPVPPLLALERPGGGEALRAALAGVPETRLPDADEPGVDDLAYILYTSGSTGKPKGVMHSHRNALAFVDWCVETFAPQATDRFSSHAPFHFDLSILDLYVPAATFGTVVLVHHETGKDPAAMATLIAERHLTVWYSTPSVLTLLVEYGKLERHSFPDLRIVCFAGEVFPVKHLRALTRALPRPAYYNLYGPTETNVCTWHPVPLPVPDARTEPYPIGAVCSNYSARVVDHGGMPVPPGAEGELCISGPGVMLGYWGLDEQTAQSFLTTTDGRWYRTGDVVTEAGDRTFTYRGRRDRMVKRHGYRVELGEIEAGLYRHPSVKEAAVIAVPHEAGVRIVAHIVWQGAEPAGIVAMKRFCAETLPASMIPDAFTFHASLPKTSTDKVDYQRLTGLV